MTAKRQRRRRRSEDEDGQNGESGEGEGGEPRDEHNQQPSSNADSSEWHFGSQQQAEAARDGVDRIRDQLLRSLSLWRRLPVLLCQEGGLQSVGPEPCWNGTSGFSRRYRWRPLGPGIGRQRGNPEFPPGFLPTDKFARHRFALASLAEQLNERIGGWLLADDPLESAGNWNGTEDGPSPGEGIPLDDEDRDSRLEGSGFGEEAAEWEDEEDGQVWGRPNSGENSGWRAEAGGKSSGSPPSTGRAAVVLLLLSIPICIALILPVFL